MQFKVKALPRYCQQASANPTRTKSRALFGPGSATSHVKGLYSWSSLGLPVVSPKVKGAPRVNSELNLLFSSTPLCGRSLLLATTPGKYEHRLAAEQINLNPPSYTHGFGVTHPIRRVGGVNCCPTLWRPLPVSRCPHYPVGSLPPP